MNSLQEAYLSIYQTQLDERMSDDEKEMRRLAAQERRAGKSDRMDAKVAKKYADSEARSASREDKKSKGKHIAGMADSFEPEGDSVEEAVYGGTAKKDEPKDSRMVVTHADKRGNTKAYQNYKAGDKRYKAGVGVDESSVPGKPAEKLVTDRAGYRVPEDEAKAARERIKAKMAARKMKKEEVEIDEAFPKVKGTLNPWEDPKTGKSTIKVVKDKNVKGGTKEVSREKLTQEEVEQIDEDSRRMSNKQRTQRVRDNIKTFKNSKIEYTPPSNYDPDANRGKGGVLTRKQIEKKRRKSLRQEGVEQVDERALDSTEKKEKERIVKGMKKSAKDFKSRYGKDAKSVMYATATKRAKERMDTSKSDLRYGVER